MFLSRNILTISIPASLLKTPGIAKKVELRVKEGCNKSGDAKGVLCTKLRIKYEDGKFEIKDKKKIMDNSDDEDEDGSDTSTSTSNSN
ncbi:MAG: hypothetical protein K9M10_01980 [Candidatus Pacebacteria bacterium]|nr:hypothetical protein [Candidatus Paceibacterota bacterium]MCF7857233.1 hypothetical protein [Candidatus Paceibacterota bacterium]